MLKFPKKSYTKEQRKRRVKRQTAKAPVKESAIQKFAEDYLDACGLAYIRIPDAIYKAIFGNGIVPIHIKVLISRFIKGLPDLTVLFPNGRYVCAELKTTKGKLSAGQKAFRILVGEQNYFTIRSTEEFKKLIDDHRKEN